jgi:tRNA-specific 2-thiouridylase
VEARLGVRRGPVIDSASGKEIGRHDGIFNFTIGQRRGLRFPSMHFVEGFDAKRNAVIVTTERARLRKSGMAVSGLNWASGAAPSGSFRAAIQMHPHQKECPALIIPKTRRAIEVRLDSPLEGIAPGQICAVYKNGVCLGGGAIEKAL